MSHSPAIRHPFAAAFAAAFANIRNVFEPCFQGIRFIFREWLFGRSEKHAEVVYCLSPDDFPIIFRLLSDDFPMIGVECQCSAKHAEQSNVRHKTLAQLIIREA